MLRNRGHNDCVLFRTRIYILRDFGIREMLYANYRVVVDPLVGQGSERSELPCLADGIIKLG